MQFESLQAARDYVKQARKQGNNIVGDLRTRDVQKIIGYIAAFNQTQQPPRDALDDFLDAYYQDFASKKAEDEIEAQPTPVRFTSRKQAVAAIRQARLGGVEINTPLTRVSLKDLQSAYDARSVRPFSAEDLIKERIKQSATLSFAKRTQMYPMHRLVIRVLFRNYARDYTADGPLSPEEVELSNESIDVVMRANEMTQQPFVRAISRDLVQLLTFQYNINVVLIRSEPSPKVVKVPQVERRKHLLRDAEPLKEDWVLSDYARCGAVKHSIHAGGCVINCLLTLKPHLNKRDQAAFIDGPTLFRHITGHEPDANGDMPLCLDDCLDLFKSARISVRAIDLKSRLIFRHDDKAGTANRRILRCVVDGKHMFLVNHDKIKEFDLRFGSVDVKECVIDDVEIKVGDNYYTPSARARTADYYSNNAEELLKHVEQLKAADDAKKLSKDDQLKYLSVITQDAEALAIQLVKLGVFPGRISCKIGRVHSFKLNYLYIRISISEYSPDDLQVCEIVDLTHYNAVADGSCELRAFLFQNDLKSTYSTDYMKLSRIYRAAVCGRLENPKSDAITYFDFSKFYTSLLSKITSVPVFSGFDHLMKYDNHKIEPLTKYYIRVDKRDLVFSEKSFDWLFGMSLNEMDADSYEIIGFIRPYEIRAFRHRGKSIKEVIKNIFNNDKLTEQDAKSILNTHIGSLGKRSNKVQVGEISDGLESCVHREFGESHFIKVRQNSARLRNGWEPISSMVLEMSRIQIKKAVDALKADGISILGIRTDAVYVNRDDAKRGERALANAGFLFGSDSQTTFERIGSLTVNHCDKIKLPNNQLKFNDSKYSEDENPENGVSPLALPHEPECVDLKSESFAGWDHDEAKALFPTVRQEPDEATPWIQPKHNPSLMISALVPGAGKTHLVRSMYADKKDGLLIVCSWNRLKTSMCEDGFTAITLHKLFGNQAFHALETHKAKYDLSGITHIHFEEVFLFSVRDLHTIYLFMQENPHLTFSGAGDEFQLPNIEQRPSFYVDYSKYHSALFAQMFPRKLVLKHNKRCRSEDDSRRMLELCQKLQSADSAEDSVQIIESTFKVIDYAEFSETPGVYNASHVSLRNETCGAVSTLCYMQQYPEGREHAFMKGDRVLGRPKDGKLLLKNEFKGAEVKNVRIHSNAVYYVAAYHPETDRLKITSDDDEEFWINMESAVHEFKRDYCQTVHSSQGLSLPGETLYVHDFGDSSADARFYYTAMTRARTMNVVFVRT